MNKHVNKKCIEQWKVFWKIKHANVHEGTFRGDGNVLYITCGGGHTGVYIFQNSVNDTLQMGAFYVYTLYLKKVDLKKLNHTKG